jgi:hypothetical protein
MLRCTLVALVALFAVSLAGCGPSCDNACTIAVECGAFDSSEKDVCVSTCNGAEDDTWLTCMNTDVCADVDGCSL